MPTSSPLTSFGSNKAFVVAVGAIKVPPSPVTNAEKIELIGRFVELCDFHLRQHQLSDFDGLTRICVANVGLKLGPVLVAVGDDPKQLLRLCRRIATPSYVGKPRKLWWNVEDQLKRCVMILSGEAGRIIDARSTIAEQQPVPAGSNGETRKVVATKSLAKLEHKTPALTKDDCQWVKSTLAAQLEGVDTDTLKTYRYKGKSNQDNTFGCDPDGRRWRRSGTPTSHPWYLKSSLISQQ